MATFALPEDKVRLQGFAEVRKGEETPLQYRLSVGFMLRYTGYFVPSDERVKFLILTDPRPAV